MERVRLPEHKAWRLEAARAEALKGVHERRPLSEVLANLVLAVEDQADVPMLASVLLVDDEGRRLLTGAAPSLPASYNAAVHGLPIGPAEGSCGTAAYYGEPVFVDDVKTDPLWSDFRELALSHGLRACWSMPVKDEAGRVIATFANYYMEPRHPRPEDFQAIAMVADVVAAAIAKDRELAGVA